MDDNRRAHILLNVLFSYHVCFSYASYLHLLIGNLFFAVIARSGRGRGQSMWVFYNYQQFFNLMIILDSCQDFLTYHQTYHESGQASTVQLSHDFAYSIWVPTLTATKTFSSTQWIASSYFVLVYILVVDISSLPHCSSNRVRSTTVSPASSQHL